MIFIGSNTGKRQGIGGSFPGGKRPEREAGHLPPFSVEVKMGGAVPPFSQYIVMMW